MEYTFKHALTQEVAYAGLTTERRRALDTAIVTAIERLSAERLGEHVERLAHHAFRGQTWLRAAMYLQQAGAKALHAYAYRQAVSDFERSLVALSYQPESRETLETLVDIKYSIAGPLLILGDPEAALAHARDALSAAEQLHDERRVALSSSRLAHLLPLLGRAVEALPFGRRALEAAKTLDEQVIYARIFILRGERTRQ